MANCYDILVTGYTENCLSGIGGIYENEFYWASYDALSALTANTSNVITNIAMSGTAKFWRIKQLRYAAAIEDADSKKICSGTIASCQQVHAGHTCLHALRRGLQ